ncbi:SPOR domain-containing protein [bacterium]|nr:SPOR domain-containing protein [bacterium]
MMKKRPTSRENSIIIGTILASGIVFIFGFFLGRAWVTIPQEQVDACQKSLGTPVVLTEEKSETPMLPKKKLLKKSVVKEKTMPAVTPQMTEVLPQEKLIPHLVKKQVKKSSIPVVASDKDDTSPIKSHASYAKKLKGKQVQQKAVMSSQKAVVQKPAAAQPKQQKIAKKSAILPQKQQMIVQKPATPKKPVMPQAVQKPVAAQPKKQKADEKPAILRQKQQIIVQKPATPKKPVMPQAVQKPVAAQPKQQEKTEKAETTQKKAERRFVLQLGSFSDKAKASALTAGLGAKGYSAYSFKVEMGEKGTWYRVYLSGIFKSRIDAQQKGDSLKSQGVIGNYFIISSK